MHHVYQSSLPLSERRKIWIKLTHAWRESQLTAKAYCEKNQLNPSDLKRWYYRLKKKQSDLISKSTVTARGAPQSFIPIQLSAQPASSVAVSTGAPIDILVGEHYRLRCCSEVDEVLLTKLLTVLRRMPSC